MNRTLSIIAPSDRTHEYSLKCDLGSCGYVRLRTLVNLSPTIAGFGTCWVCILHGARSFWRRRLDNTASTQAMSHNGPMFSPVPALQNLKPHGAVLNVWECTGKFAQIPGVAAVVKMDPKARNPEPNKPRTGPKPWGLESETLAFKSEL